VGERALRGGPRSVRLRLNLASYNPGALWQFAGLASLAAAEGASPVAASVGVLLEQVVLLGTGFALVPQRRPGLLAHWTHGLGVGVELAIAALLIAALVVGLPRLLPRVRVRAERLLKRTLPLPSIRRVRSRCTWCAAR